MGYAMGVLKRSARFHRRLQLSQTIQAELELANRIDRAKARGKRILGADGFWKFIEGLDLDVLTNEDVCALLEALPEPEADNVPDNA